jgi:hypothetical protein
VVIGAVALGLRRRAGTVLVLVGTMVAFAAAAALVAHQPEPAAWSPVVTLPAALALGGLAVTAAMTWSARDRPDRGEGPGGHRSGAVSATAVVLAAAVAIGPVAVAVAAAVGPWPELQRTPQRVPLFVDADAERVGPYRILLLEGDDSHIRWDVTEPGGPAMTTFGARPDPALHAALERAVTGLVSGDAEAAGLVGVLNVRYLVLRDAATRAAVEPALADLAGVEPLPAGGGGVYQVRTWLPRAAVVDTDLLTRALAGEPLSSTQVEAAALAPLGVGRYGGGPVDGGVLVVSESWDTSWVADAGGRPLNAIAPPARGVPVMSFDLDGPSEQVVADARPPSRAWWLAWQILVLLGLLSLALRAPGRPVGTVSQPGVLPDTARAPSRGGALARGAGS